MTAKIPHLIELVVDKDGVGRGIKVDGTEFPYAVGTDVTMDWVDRGHMKTLTIALIADDIRIVTEPQDDPLPQA